MEDHFFEGEHATFRLLLSLMFLLSLVTALATSLISAPYGRHVRLGFGPQIPARLGWIVMESPALWCTCLVFSRGRYTGQLAARVLLGLYMFHYIHRTVVYPMRAKLKAKQMPVLVAALAFAYNTYNGYIQGYRLSAHQAYPVQWLWSPQVALGFGLFVAGLCTNVWADSVLFGLRTSDTDRSYKVPKGFLYELISCPNYFGEIVEWLGWAVMTWSWAGLSFFVYTCCNLIPRAVAHHDWYKGKFDDYPQNRKAVIPFLV